jgi:predicted ATPase
VTAAESLEPDGSNLATVLARIQAETRTNARPKGALADIAADLASLVSGVADLSVSEDEQNREYRIDVAFREGPPFTSRVISDGTLRLLALLALLHDPKRRGLVCFEEPENGIHPSRVKALIEKLRNLVADPSRADVDNEEPLSQILLNSHSPVVLSSLQDTEMLFAEMVSLASPGAASVTQRTRIRPVRRGDTEGMFDADEEVISSAYVNRYLSTVEAAGADR